MAGDHDECDPSLSREMHEKIAGSKLVILPNSGHMNFVDQPELWQKTVKDFLRTIDSAANATTARSIKLRAVV